MRHRGISFPFRVGNKGGVVMSNYDITDHTHLHESIEQIVQTYVGERVMERIGCNLSASIFEPDEESTYSLLSYEIFEALKAYEPRVTVSIDDIEFSYRNEAIYCTINYTSVSLEGDNAPITFKIGG